MNTIWALSFKAHSICLEDLFMGLNIENLLDETRIRGCNMIMCTLKYLEQCFCFSMEGSLTSLLKGDIHYSSVQVKSHQQAGCDNHKRTVPLNSGATETFKGHNIKDKLMD